MIPVVIDVEGGRGVKYIKDEVSFQEVCSLFRELIFNAKARGRVVFITTANPTRDLVVEPFEEDGEHFLEAVRDFATS